MIGTGLSWVTVGKVALGFVVGAGIIWGLVWLIIKYLSQYVLKPFLETRGWIDEASIVWKLADKITDELVKGHPEASWDNILDKTVDVIGEGLGFVKEASKEKVKAIVREVMENKIAESKKEKRN